MKIKHLEMLQSIINRMANNSFLLKGWSVSLVTALFAIFAAKDFKIYFIFLIYFPSLFFWLLDGYFLQQERLYRKLYDRVRQQDESGIDFSMSTAIVSNQVKSWLSTCFSKTLLIFHGAIVVTIIIVMFITLIKQ